MTRRLWARFPLGNNRSADVWLEGNCELTEAQERFLVQGLIERCKQEKGFLRELEAFEAAGAVADGLAPLRVALTESGEREEPTK